jgi:hypothetical protein
MESIHADNYAPSFLAVKLGHFEYRFRNRHVGILWACIYAILGFLISAYGLLYGHGRMIGLVGIWSIGLLLILLALYAERRNTRLLQTVTLTEEGIVTAVQRIKFDFWPNGERGLIRWDEIEYIDEVSWPHTDADPSTYDPSALCIVAADRKIVIYKKIRGFQPLWEILQAQMRKHSKIEKSATIGLIGASLLHPPR